MGTLQVFLKPFQEPSLFSPHWPQRPHYQACSRMGGAYKGQRALAQHGHLTGALMPSVYPNVP